ncbi:TRAP transporter small permease subunit [Cognatishimia sp. F0-27]|uniref:TRAP transporter small permease subunit n=1 Tax=Cognatishimia sp. F0-27 TaxID=2816855 RepID=UPI001D0BFC5A|nr:TRAP transporter small permease [Cognatishimia sp. F0-27]MCC1491506.1 TRAP transporter small permease [Cognatishimia sp. F0-27]
MAEQILTRLKTINRAVALIVGLGLLGTALFVLADILLRQVGSSFGGTDEISGYAMAIASSWGMAYAMLELGHVRIDILRARLAQGGRVLFDLFSLLVLSASITLIAVKCWPVLEKSLSNSSRANTPLETPLWWVQMPWMAGWIWFALMAWVTFLAALLLVWRREYESAERHIGAFGEAEMAEVHE